MDFMCIISYVVHICNFGMSRVKHRCQISAVYDLIAISGSCETNWAPVEIHVGLMLLNEKGYTQHKDKCILVLNTNFKSPKMEGEIFFFSD